MKRIIMFISSVAMTFCISSCKKDALNIDPSTLDNKTDKCWIVTITQSIDGVTTSSSWNEWVNERALVISLQKNKGMHGYSASYKEDNRYIGQSACENANK